jgi:uncharacterized protein YegP (UPF0339 family)
MRQKAAHNCSTTIRMGRAMMTFEVYKDAKGEFRWRLRHQNGNVLATASEGYSSKAACLKCIDNVQNSGSAEIVEA